MRGLYAIFAPNFLSNRNNTLHNHLTNSIMKKVFTISALVAASFGFAMNTQGICFCCCRLPLQWYKLGYSSLHLVCA